MDDEITLFLHEKFPKELHSCFTIWLFHKKYKLIAFCYLSIKNGGQQYFLENVTVIKVL